MSTVLRPVGPRPGRVYWVRRLVVLVALAVLVVVVLAVVSAALGRGADDDSSPATGGERAVEGADGDGATEGGDGPGGATAGGTDGEAEVDATDGAPADAPSDASGDAAGAEAGAQGAGPVACAPQDLTLTLTSDARSYGPGAAVSFTMAFLNAGTQPCVVDVGSAGQALVVTSGSDRIWSSADCPATGTPRTLLLAAGAQDTETVVWPRVRSDESCSAELPEPRPGTYTAVAVLAGAQSAPVVLELE